VSSIDPGGGMTRQTVQYGFDAEQPRLLRLGIPPTDAARYGSLYALLDASEAHAGGVCPDLDAKVVNFSRWC
jgi:hypothetical protein